MISAEATSELVTDLVPLIYDDARARLQLPMQSEMSRGNRCDLLTLDLFEALDNRGVEARRELHVARNGNWHFMIAHAAIDAAPSQQDLVTDLTPWQWPEASRGKSGFLHASRLELQQTLGFAGAPAWFVSLRGIATITRPHTTPAARLSHV